MQSVLCVGARCLVSVIGKLAHTCLLTDLGSILTTVTVYPFMFLWGVFSVVLLFFKIFFKFFFVAHVVHTDVASHTRDNRNTHFGVVLLVSSEDIKCLICCRAQLVSLILCGVFLCVCAQIEYVG